MATQSPWHAAATVYSRREATYRTMRDFVNARVSNPLDPICREVVRAIDPDHELLERREQLTVRKTLKPQVNGMAPIRQQRAAASYDADGQNGWGSKE